MGGARQISALVRSQHDGGLHGSAKPGKTGPLRRRGRAAEGGGLLNRYTVNIRIEGSNPSVSAILLFLLIRRWPPMSRYPRDFPFCRHYDLTPTAESLPELLLLVAKDWIPGFQVVDSMPRKRGAPR